MVPLARQVDNACLSYDLRFDANFDWSLGGKLPGLSGVAPGVSPTLPAGGGNPGDKGWSGRLMWRAANGRHALLHVRPRAGLDVRRRLPLARGLHSRGPGTPSSSATR